MIRHVLALACLTLSAAAAWAQAPPITGEPQPSRVFCDQSVTYRVAEQAAVPEPYRRFLGAWTDAAWDANTCAALIVENIDPNGTASIIYAYGPLGSSARATGGTLHGTGIIRDGELRFQNSDNTQFAFRPGIADLIGRMTTPNGQSYEAAFKKAL
ncbi:MAG: hypothetical protein JOZ11_09070 [Alphaproteobacteria bacterium]|nr:hypothetical protein [Alphaproteobacteria bacterium]